MEKSQETLNVDPKEETVRRWMKDGAVFLQSVPVYELYSERPLPWSPTGWAWIPSSEIPSVASGKKKAILIERRKSNVRSNASIPETPKSKRSKIPPSLLRSKDEENARVLDERLFSFSRTLSGYAIKDTKKRVRELRSSNSPVPIDRSRGKKRTSSSSTKAEARFYVDELESPSKFYETAPIGFSTPISPVTSRFSSVPRSSEKNSFTFSIFDRGSSDAIQTPSSSIRWRSRSEIMKTSPGYEKLRKEKNSYWDRHPGSLPPSPELDFFEKHADLYFSDTEDDWILPGEKEPFWKTHRKSLERAIGGAIKNLESRFHLATTNVVREDLVPKSADDLDFSRTFSFASFLWYVDEYIGKKRFELQRLARTPTLETMNPRKQEKSTTPGEEEETVFSDETEEEEEFAPYSSLPETEEEGESTIVLSEKKSKESFGGTLPQRRLIKPPVIKSQKRPTLSPRVKTTIPSTDATKRFALSKERSSCSVFQDVYLYSLSYESRMRNDGRRKGDGEFSLFRLSSDKSAVTEVWAIKVPKTAAGVKLSIVNPETTTTIVPHFEFGETVTMTDASFSSLYERGEVYYEGKDGIKVIGASWKDLLNEDPQFENALPLIKTYFADTKTSGGTVVRGSQELDKTIVFKHDFSKDPDVGHALSLVFEIPFLPKEILARSTLDRKAWYTRHLYQLGSNRLLEQIAFNPNVAMSRKTLTLDYGSLNLRSDHRSPRSSTMLARIIDPVAGDSFQSSEERFSTLSFAKRRTFHETSSPPGETMAGGGEEEEETFLETSNLGSSARRLEDNRGFFVSNDTPSFRNFEKRPIEHSMIDYVLISEEDVDRYGQTVSKTVGTALSLVVKDSDESTPLISTEECKFIVETKDGAEIKTFYEPNGLKENDPVTVDLNAKEDFITLSNFEKTVKTLPGGISSETTTCKLRLKRKKVKSHAVSETPTTTTTTTMETIGSDMLPIECMTYERDEENVIFDLYYYNNAWGSHYEGCEITNRGNVVWYDKVPTPEVRKHLTTIPMETVEDLYDLLIKSKETGNLVKTGCPSVDAGKTRYVGYVYDYKKKTRNSVTLMERGNCESHNDSIYAEALVETLSVIYEQSLGALRTEEPKEGVDAEYTKTALDSAPSKNVHVGPRIDENDRKESIDGVFVIYDGIRDAFSASTSSIDKEGEGKKWKTMSEIIDAYSTASRVEESDVKAAFFIHLLRTNKVFHRETAKVYFLKWREPEARGNFEIVEKSIYFTKKS